MKSAVFAVNDEPYCLWEVDVRARNREFLGGLDVDYFSYVLETHCGASNEHRALVSLRIALHHATETLFSLIGAFTQAPECAYAWISKCSNVDLREFVERVSTGSPATITKLSIHRVTWPELASAVLQSYLPGTEKQARTIACFADLWARLAAELTDSSAVDEYNALKHGFRIKSGGFQLAVGVEATRGVPPKAEEMKALGGSEFGATFLKMESIGNGKGRHIRSRQTSMNWSAERIVLQLQLVCMSINNVVSALKIVNGEPASTCRFVRPELDEDFDRPWQHSPGVTNMNFDVVLDESRLPSITKAELLAKLRNS